MKIITVTSQTNNATTESSTPKLNCTPIVRGYLTIGVQFFITKYTAEVKLVAVLDYLEGKKSFQSSAKKR